MRKMTVKSKAWIPASSSLGPEDLRDPESIHRLSIGRFDMSDIGYTFVGEAEITVEIPDEKTLVANKVEALRNELASVRAEATMKATQIEGRINDLLAIGYDATVTA